jgi:hypothetical protein
LSAASRIPDRVACGVIASGSTLIAISDGPDAAKARSIAGPKSAVVSTVSPVAP